MSESEEMSVRQVDGRGFPGGRIIGPVGTEAGAGAAKVYDLQPIRQMLAAARRIRREAQAEADRIRQEARKEGVEIGRREGIEIGRREGIQRGLAEAEEVVRGLSALLDELRRQRALLTAQAEERLLDLALAIASRIVRARVEIDPQTVLRQVKAAVQLATGRDRIRIHLAPADVEAVRQFLPELSGLLSKAGAARKPEDIELVPDPSVERGGCIVRTADGEVDAQITTQLEEIHRQLLP